MQIRRILVLISTLALSAVFCSFAKPSAPQDLPAAMTAGAPSLPADGVVQPTQPAAQPTQAPVTGATVVVVQPTQGTQPTPEPTEFATPGSIGSQQVPPPQGGQITGQLSYPSSFIPPMDVIAFSVVRPSEYYAVQTAQNQGTYSLPVPSGDYYVLSYVHGGNYAGGYTPAVGCGLTVDCTAHSLIPVHVAPGAVVSGINPGDWYAPDGTFPANPMAAQGGQITGQLSYPSEFIPPMDVVAFRVGGSASDYYYVQTQQGQGSYSLGVPAGDYYVLSYVQGGNFAGGYTPAVACGLSVDCTDHSLLVVHVGSGAVVSGINPGDWYAPEGTFPANPVP